MKDEEFGVYAPSCGYFPKVNSEPLLFWDEFIPGNFYYATTDQIKDAMYHFNRNFSLRGSARYSEFLEFMNITPTERSKEYGWNAWMMAEEGWASWIDFCIFKKEDEDWYRITYSYPPVSAKEMEEYE